jgi:hypothetical protein
LARHPLQGVRRPQKNIYDDPLPLTRSSPSEALDVTRYFLP